MVGPLTNCYEVTACLEAGRLLLFISRNNETYNAYDDESVLEKSTVCYHRASPPFPGSGGKKLAPFGGFRAPRASYITNAI